MASPELGEVRPPARKGSSINHELKPWQGMRHGGHRES